MTRPAPVSNRALSRFIAQSIVDRVVQRHGVDGESGVELVAGGFNIAQIRLVDLRGEHGLVNQAECITGG